MYVPLYGYSFLKFLLCLELVFYSSLLVLLLISLFILSFCCCVCYCVYGPKWSDLNK